MVYLLCTVNVYLLLFEKERKGSVCAVVANNLSSNEYALYIQTKVLNNLISQTMTKVKNEVQTNKNMQTQLRLIYSPFPCNWDSPPGTAFSPLCSHDQLTRSTSGKGGAQNRDGTAGSTGTRLDQDRNSMVESPFFKVTSRIFGCYTAACSFRTRSRLCI